VVPLLCTHDRPAVAVSAQTWGRSRLMWITGEVDLPDEILDAHERGELVFFIGAGASLASPSNLPLFDGLARKLARRASHPFSKRGGLDFFVGQLESLRQEFDAHHHARELIANPKSRFNSLHHAIVELAGMGGAFRVVTTNYDDHLAAAATSATVKISDTWYSPALPVGRDFVGLVHLHGSVLRPKEEMILTDRDFGRAYITDAWAARFLLPMFERFTVVFIGYSHDDVIMRYLALGLPSGEDETERRFAFTTESSDSKWAYLGIRPIAYPVVGRDHRALVAALGAWGERARMGQTDHQARMQAIIGGGATLPPPDRDYLHARLRVLEGARDFADATASLPDDAKLAWLLWLEDLPEFKGLFLSRDVSDASAILGHWFARTFIESPTLNVAALHTLQRLGQSMTNSLYRIATLIVHELEKQDAAAGGRWQAVLSSSIHGQSAPKGTDFFMPFLPEATARSTAVLRTALRPQLLLERRWFVDDPEDRTIPPDAKVTWSSEEYALTQQILLSVQAAPAGDRSLGGALEDALIAAYDLLDAYHGKRHWDPLTHDRSAIEPHAQDEMRNPLDSIVDGLREYGLRALSIRPELPDQWWDFDRALMCRLALHFITSDPARSDDAKLEWLLERTGLYAENLKHETFQLLSATIPGSSLNLKKKVLDAVNAGRDFPEEISDRDRHLAYAKFNLLVWLTQVDPNWREAQVEFETMQAEEPDFGAREHPDFDTWMSIGTWGGKPPMAIEDFIQALADDVPAALDELLSRDYSERYSEQPDWSDALEIVRLAAQRRVDLGIKLWDSVAERVDLGEKQGELWRSLVGGWADAGINAFDTAPVERVAALVADPDSAHAIGRFVLEQVRQQIDLDESPLLGAMRELARALWRTQGGAFTHRKDSMPLSLAPLYLNSWPGFLAQYWSGEVDRRWRHHREDWTGLSSDESSAIIELLSGNRYALDATQPAVAGQLFFYFAADEDFATTHVLPIFRDDETHAFGWHPFLYHPRWNDRLLQAGLLESMITELVRLNTLPDETLHHIFLGFVASVVSHAGISSADRRRLLDQTVLASDGSNAAGFAEEVARFVRLDNVDGSEMWRHWLGKHVERRLSGQPRVASPEELARWADVVPAVGEFVPTAAALFSGHNIGLGERFFNREFPEDALASHSAVLVAFLAERVRNTSGQDQMINYGVKELLEAVRGATGEVIAQPLVDAARDGGFINGSW
jgi:hypothetical protein